MSPSPRWSSVAIAEAPLFQALAAAQHAAWLAPEERRRAVFVERFRQLAGVDAVCGRRSGATNVKVWWMRHFGAPPAHIGRGRPGKKVAHSDKSWWTTRLKDGATTWQLAEELQINDTSVREKLRTLGGDMLAWGYRNNTAAEKKRRQPDAKPWWAKSTEAVPV